MCILALCMKNLDTKVKWGFDSANQENSNNLHLNSSYESNTIRFKSLYRDDHNLVIL